MVSLSALAHTHLHTHTLNQTASPHEQKNGGPTGAGAHDMQCRLPCHVLQHLHYPRAEQCTWLHRFQRKGTCQMGLTSETTHHSTSIQDSVVDMSCQQYSAPVRNRAMLSSRKSKSTIEIENRRAVGASMSLSEISDVQPGRLPTHTAAYF